jgi:hypothetical protein
MSDVKTTITRDGQRYVDEPILARPKPASRVELSVQAAFDPQGLKRRPTPIVVGHERVMLRWVTPDGKGGLKPREGR